ncbi:coniferyl aldehyde dehydrogenase [SAR86 cluster bacterium]|nr:coniferyl aldehyde dehydrogenase [SAR86 cluster bacterium]
MTIETIQEMEQVLKLQKKLYVEEETPSMELRQDRLARCVAMLKKYNVEILDAIQQDFGNRDSKAGFMSEIMSTIGSIESSKENVKKWMKDEKRKSNTSQPFAIRSIMSLAGAKSWIKYQPLGTVGVISPWNFPINLVLAPLGTIFAAGNRVMIKPSEFTPVTSELTKKMFKEYFDSAEAAVFTGGADVAASFSSLAFDHLLFTGSTQTGKLVMRSASENLVPVTLELGGKSPVIVDEKADLKKTATRVMRGKTMNAGQICLAPDYVMVPKGKSEEFVKESEIAVTEMYENLKYNESYTSVINEKHYDRLNSLIEDAKQKGADIRVINPANEDFSQQEVHKIPPTLVLNPTDDMDIMKEEIFGPLLPVKEYEDFNETINYVNANDRPLGLYYFGDDKKREADVLNNTISGGVTLNDVIWHIGQEDIPFGGVGPSGTGNYHGFDGFKNFSHAKAIYKQFSIDLLAPMMPPYKGKMFKSTKESVLK